MKSGLAESSVRRFWGIAVGLLRLGGAERMILVNPVAGTKVLRSSERRVEMYPFGEANLERVYGTNARTRSLRLPKFCSSTPGRGLRWSELLAHRVRDFVDVPLPVLVVQVAEPEGVAVKVTKSRKSRRVPVADRILPMVPRMATNREPDAPLFTTCTGHQLHATASKRTLDWPVVGEGHRIHDLRHTAACLWLARGVDPVTGRRGWVMPRSRRRICICMTWERPLTRPDWPV